MIKSVQFMSVHKAEALIPDRPTVAVSILSSGMEDAKSAHMVVDVLPLKTIG